MTNAFVRIQRNGKWQPVEIDDLTDTELDKFLRRNGKLDAEECFKWAKYLAGWIRDHQEPPPMRTPDTICSACRKPCDVKVTSVLLDENDWLSDCCEKEAVNLDGSELDYYQQLALIDDYKAGWDGDLRNSHEAK